MYRTTTKPNPTWGGFTYPRCPWCEHDPYSRYSWVRRKVFKSGSREAKRALRSGRAKIITLSRGYFSRASVDRVVCAHPCHDL